MAFPTRDIVLKDQIVLNATTQIKRTFDKDVTFGELLSSEKTAEYTRTKILPYNEMFAAGNNEDMQEMMGAMAKYMPLRALRSFSRMTKNKIVEELNQLQ